MEILTKPIKFLVSSNISLKDEKVYDHRDNYEKL